MAKVQIDNLRKVFPGPGGGHVALEGVSFEVADHEFTSIVGPSGCGKTTLLNIVSGVDTPTSGTVRLREGEDDCRIGYVFQEPRLLPWRTIHDNLRYVLDGNGRDTAERIDHYLALVGLAGCGGKYPSQLSGGMQQRAGIARAFAVDPDLLLMDEPFSHLDAITARSLRIHLQNIWLQERKTVLFVTHDVMEAVELSDRIIVLAPGGQLYEEINIDLERPRRSSDPAVATLKAEILGRFETLEQHKVGV